MTRPYRQLYYIILYYTRLWIKHTSLKYLYKITKLIKKKKKFNIKKKLFDIQ